MEHVDFSTWVIFITLIALAVVIAIVLARRRQSAQHLSPDLQEKFETLKEVCQLTHDALIVVDRNREIVFANQAAYRLSSLRLHKPLTQLDRSLKFLLPDKKEATTLDAMIRQHRSNRQTEKSSFGEVTLEGDKETSYRIDIGTHHFQTSHQRYDTILIHDQSHEKKLLQLHHLHSLTGLPNQFKAYGDISQLTAQSGQKNFAIVILELDHAAYLRSILGYGEMDNILTAIANVLRELQEDHPHITIYHLSYVTFMLVIRQPKNLEEIYGLFAAIQRTVQERYNLREEKQALSFSAGISLYPRHGTLYNLFNSAFGALAEAQKQGSGQIIVAGENYKKDIDHELHLNNEIKRALKKGEFKLFFQPLYDSHNHTLAGAEVLLRWQHPEQGMIMPDVFIPVAERSGLITEIGRYVANEALRHLSHWNSFDFPPIRLTINLSLRELESPDFTANLTALLYKYDIGECELKYEITEHSAMLNPQLTHARLNEIRQLGIGIALDDFGTGYSSFSHLAEFPIDTLKIDRGFVSDISNNPGHRHIVSAMIKLGHSLGMTIVAEGIESRADAALLDSLGADYLQGYYFSRPIPQLEFQYLLTHPKDFSTK